MRMTMTNQAAGITDPLVGDWGSTIRSNDIGVKIHHALSGNESGVRTHSVCRVAYGAGKTVVDMASVSAETGVADNTSQIMTFGTQSIIASRAQIRRRIQVGDRLTRNGRLAHVVAAF